MTIQLNVIYCSIVDHSLSKSCDVEEIRHMIFLLIIKG